MAHLHAILTLFYQMKNKFDKFHVKFCTHQLNKQVRPWVLTKFAAPGRLYAIFGCRNSSIFYLTALKFDSFVLVYFRNMTWLYATNKTALNFACSLRQPHSLKIMQNNLNLSHFLSNFKLNLYKIYTF